MVLYGCLSINQTFYLSTTPGTTKTSEGSSPLPSSPIFGIQIKIIKKPDIIKKFSEKCGVLSLRIWINFFFEILDPDPYNMNTDLQPVAKTGTELVFLLEVIHRIYYQNIFSLQLRFLRHLSFFSGARLWQQDKYTTTSAAATRETPIAAATTATAA